MNREIKFRAWDIYNKVFIPADTFALLIHSEYGALAVMIKDWEDYKVGEFMYPNTQTLSQFTGLTDKNGKEIYEGDVLMNPTHKDFAMGVVEYEIQAAAFWIVWRFKNESRYSTLKATFSDGEVFRTDSWEVIGNNYETPELSS